MTVPQNWERYSAADHRMWDCLFGRQSRLMRGRAAPEFLSGLNLLGLDRPGIPRFDELSQRLMRLTGWEVVAVPGLIPNEIFFDHLANRRFVSGNFIRSPEQFNYLEEPDVFHDVFGHLPMLAHPVFADYMQAFGKGARKAAAMGAIERLSRLYWYTAEFGLMRYNDELRIYGAGIVSSYGETMFALDDPSPNRLSFDLERIMRTSYRIDDFQQSYFVADSFEDLLETTLNTEFAPLYADLAGSCDIDPGAVLSCDEVTSRGSQCRAPALSPARPERQFDGR